MKYLREYHLYRKSSDGWESGALIFPTIDRAYEMAEPGDRIEEWQFAAQHIVLENEVQ